MPTVDVRTSKGRRAGSIELDESVFGIQPHVPVMHQVVTAQLAAARSGTQSTKTRAEVSGGGAKPFRQKGTGRARQGSTRAPHWSGGGIALGPKPRSYRQRTPKKMIRLALHSALSDRVAEGRVAVLDRWGFTEPRTKDAKAVLDALGIEGKVMVVVDAEDAFAIKSLRNLPEVTLVTSNEINAYDVLCSDWVLFTRDVLPGTTVEVEGAPVDGPVDEPEAVDEPESVVEPEAEAADEPEAEAADEPEAVVEPEAPDEADAADEETDA